MVNVIGAEAMVVLWVCTVTFVVPNGSGKCRVWDWPAGTVTGAGETAPVPLNRIVKTVLSSAATGDEFKVMSTVPPVAVWAPAAIVAVEAAAAGVFEVPAERRDAVGDLDVVDVARRRGDAGPEPELDLPPGALG